MSEHATQLAVLLVDELFGELPSKVFYTLAFNGRLPFASLLHHTQLAASELKHGLAILIQQHLVLWYDPDYTGRAFYEADVSNAYSLSRSGTYPRLLKDRRGGNDRLRNVASDLISDLVLLGHVRVGDLTQTYFPDFGEQGPLGEVILSNYRAVKTNLHSVNDLHSSISDLLISGFLRPVHESYLRPAADNMVEAESVVPRDDSYRLKTEVQAAWEKSVRSKLEEWQYGSRAETKFIPQAHKGRKRGLEDGELVLQNKKAKLSDPQSHGSSGNGSETQPTGWLDADLALRINHEKFAILIRNQQLATLVDESLSETTAIVYADLLRNAEIQLRKCKDRYDTIDHGNEIDPQLFPRVSTDDLEHLLLDLPGLADSLALVAPDKINLQHFDHRKKKRRRQGSTPFGIDDAHSDGSDGEEESETESTNQATIQGANDSEDLSVDGKTDSSGSDNDFEHAKPDNEHASGKKRRYRTPDTTPDNTPKTNGVKQLDHPVRQHLLLLAEHPNRFLIHIPQTSKDPEKWAIPYPALSKLLFQNALLSITTSRFGPLAGRLLRILCTHSEKNTANPKLDEKMLVLLSLIPQKAMRTILHNMHRAGHIELQEVPKDSTQRRPGTTMFFWFFDPERCRARMLEECYKTMANLIRRARVEREGVRGVVEKSERTDVVGREEEFLGDGELKALKEWRGTEERIWGEVGRLDGLVAVLRDF
ncbi:MAG: hypothetical protein Q9218_003459 [Villophora microphyllina]